MKRVFSFTVSLIVLFTLALSTVLFSACEEQKPEKIEWITAEYVADPVSVDPNYGQFVADGDKDISIGVLADIHVMSETQAVDMTCSDYKSWEAHGQKMLGLSESILKTAVDRIITESDFDVVLVSGDNADDGGYLSHVAVASELKRLENAGIKVFTIPGNHDINNNSYTYASGTQRLTRSTSEVEFASIYADFGYNGEDVVEYYKNEGTEAAATDANFVLGDNLSYVADLSDKYRLIAIDMCHYTDTYYLQDNDGSYAAAGYDVDEDGYVLVNGERYTLARKRHDGAMTTELLDWVKKVTIEAVQEGKIPIGMMHFPLLQHFGPLVQAENGAVNDPDTRAVADVLANAGMKFIFTGHIHIQDDALYTTRSGNKILDINSASLCNYPTPVRYFRAKGDTAYVRTWNMNSEKEEYLPSYLSQEEKDALLADFTAYSVAYLDGSMLAKIKNKIDMDMVYKILSKLGVKKNGQNDAQVTSLAEDVYNDVILKFLKLPLYEKDANGGLSVESAAKAYGVVIPQSDYTDVFNLAMSFVASMYGGDESCVALHTRVVLLKYSIYTALKVIDDFDLFAKIRQINPNFAEIDLSASLSDLYRTGKLDLCNNNLLIGLVSSLKVSGLDSFKDLIGSANAYGALRQIKKLKVISALLPDGLELGFKPEDYIEADPDNQIGCILFADLLDDAIASFTTLGLTNDSLEKGSTYKYKKGVTDSAPGDNNLTINMTTMAYSTLK